MKHLQDTDQNYFTHLGRALWIAAKLASYAIISVIHAIAPDLFINTVSNGIAKLHNTLKQP